MGHFGVPISTGIEIRELLIVGFHPRPLGHRLTCLKWRNGRGWFGHSLGSRTDDIFTYGIQPTDSVTVQSPFQTVETVSGLLSSDWQVMVVWFMITIRTEFAEPVLLDDDVAEKLQKVTIRVDTRGYPFFYRYHGKRKYKCHLHRYVLPAPFGYVTDHINGNRLDVQRSNLRLLTVAQNARNRLKKTDAECEYKGVFKNRNKFRSVIVFGYQKFELGIYESAEEAAAMYDAAAMILDTAYKTNFDANDSRVLIAQSALASNRRLYKRLLKAKHPEREVLPRGVSRNGSKYQAQLKLHGQRIHLGTFSTAQEAHTAYTKALIQCHKDGNADRWLRPDSSL